MTHVLIVNTNTFKYHLEYMFAGTGGKRDASFLFNDEIQLNWKAEASIVDMVSDISRIRRGDKIIFYVQANNGAPGKFYGVFQVKEAPFYDSNENNYLFEELHKNLNFRVEIEPDVVYSKGVSERIALDVLDGINHPSEMCWSLIYRKLKGNRGCTMITDYEACKLIEKIRVENLNNVLEGNSFSYDTEKEKIVLSNKTVRYNGEKNSLSIKDRMLLKYRQGNAFEAHLQAYIIQNCLENPLRDLLHIETTKSTWIGNEVSCGVGMQRIDVATIQEDDNSVIINIIELKSCEPYNDIVIYQLPWYIDWVKNYWCPLYNDKEVTINPIVIAQKSNELINNSFHNVANTLVYPVQDNVSVSAVEYIGFEIDEDISFEKVF